MSEGFLSRWSRRKLDVKEGKPGPESAQPGTPTDLPPHPATDSLVPDAALQGSATATHAHKEIAEPKELAPAPTLAEVQTLTWKSDFKRFAAANVSPEVKNAAMKKLFADPRFNVMDGLDVYTGDYAQPDPIPAAMLRQLVSAKFLGLFNEDHQHEPARGARDVADSPLSQAVSQSDPVPSATPVLQSPTDHDDPDLQLQQDHAAPGEDPGHGAQ